MITLAISPWQRPCFRKLARQPTEDPATAVAIKWDPPITSKSFLSGSELKKLLPPACAQKSWDFQLRSFSGGSAYPLEATRAPALAHISASGGKRFTLVGGPSKGQTLPPEKLLNRKNQISCPAPPCPNA